MLRSARASAAEPKEVSLAVCRRQVGRAFVYRPLVEQRTARRRALGHLIKALFDNSPSQVVLDVLHDERLGPGEIERLKRLIAEA